MESHWGSTILGKRMLEASRATGLIALTGVSKYYPDGDVRALSSINLTIGEGEFVTIVGPSGCGKSTLLHLLGGLDTPTQGDVHFRGKSLRDCNLNHYRSQDIGFVFQSFYLLPNLTALENVQIPMFGGPLSASQRATEARRLLDSVGLGNRLSHLPNQLSVGQRQRVAIARSIANRPSILLADEPTGSLDSASGQEVMELLVGLNEQEQTTLVVVTHDDGIARRGRRIIRMLDGAIVADDHVPAQGAKA